MRVAISQPEHFPYLGFFQKMCAADLFVILDDVQFSGPRSFQNRNRYLDRNKVYQWFTVPVKRGSYNQLIKDVEVCADYAWRKKLKRRLAEDLKFLCFDKIYNYEKLIDINMASISCCRDVFGITTPMIYSSDLHVSGAKTERIFNICNAVGANIYVAGLGSMEYMRNAHFDDIQIEFFHPNVENFESSLVFINNKTEEIKKRMQHIQTHTSLYCRGM